jgi:endoglucanase
MRNIKKLLLILFTVCVFLTSTVIVNASEVKAQTETSENLKTASQKYAEAMEPGWNLGNTFDSFDTGGDRGEESWGNPRVTKELIHTIKAQGFNSIRMPFTSVMRTGAAPDYKLDPAFLARYAEVIQWALDEGLYVMINLHHDSWNWAGAIGASWDNGASMARYKAIWAQLADYFKDYSDKVCFESLNEPQFWSGDTANQIKIMEQVNTEFYNIVRNSGGGNATRMLVLPTLNTNDSDDRCESLYNTIKGFNDPNIIATFHFYGFWPFSTNIAGVTTMNEQVVNELKACFDRIYNHFVANGIGVVCGEYGLLGFDRGPDVVEHGEILKFFEYVNYYAKAKGITMMLWDNGCHMNRSTYTWRDQSLYDMIKASWTTRSSYSESDRIFIQDTDLDQHIPLKLVLNGNELKSINNGNEKLEQGIDYTYDEDAATLNIKQQYLWHVITENYGINATLTLKFSQGADWNVYLTHYSTPTLGTAEAGDTSGFAIPVNFNGTRLSTLEATYADGSGAGPQNWTTYKEYGYAFTVDYAANTVTFTNKFFAETKDGEINLKFHFQSGEILEYKIQKAGGVVYDPSGPPPVPSDTTTPISSIKYDFSIADATPGSSITFKITGSNWVDYTQTIQLTGAGDYSVSFDLSAAPLSGLINMGYFVTDTASTAVATLKKVTVNGTYELAYDATLKVNSTWENGLKNIWSGLSAGQKIAEGTNAYIAFKNDLLVFYTKQQ